MSRKINDFTVSPVPSLEAVVYIVFTILYEHQSILVCINCCPLSTSTGVEV